MPGPLILLALCLLFDPYAWRLWTLFQGTLPLSTGLILSIFLHKFPGGRVIPSRNALISFAL
jgi:hypothetical protein